MYIKISIWIPINKSMYKYININILKNIRECMKVIKYTKVQSVAGSLTSTIPAVVRDLYKLEKGDTIEWTVDTKTDTITLRKIE